MKKAQHLSDDVLVRLLDDELPQEEAICTQSHIDACAECRRRYAELHGVSNHFEAFAHTIAAPFAESERDALVLLLNTQPPPLPRDHGLPRVIWAMAIAASLVLGILIAPRLWYKHAGVASTDGDRSSAALLEVDGETFVPLPYSNPDLPVSEHRIVQMQIPISSLVDAGVHFEAISNEASGTDESVLADVLLGIDGQPLGVHVLGTSN